MALAYDKSLRTYDAYGRMHIKTCNISKANVCAYLGAEIPFSDELGLDPNRIYQLYRDPEELARGAQSFANMPLMLVHVKVNAEDPHQELTVGTIGSDVRFEAPYLKASIAVWTADAIAVVERGIQEQLSCGYRYRADMTPGISPDGIMYDGVMRDILANHVALVERGRAGPDVVVADSHPFQVVKSVKYSKFLTALAAILGVQIKPEQQVALDEAMKDDEDEKGYDAELDEEEKKAAKDAMMKEMGKDSLLPDEEKEAYKKAALDKRRARDEAVVLPSAAAQDKAPAITQDQLDAAVAAAVSQAEAKTKAAATALATARDAVKPHVGAVALDSADAVYSFALGKLGVALDGIPAAAYPALLAAVVKSIPGKPVPAAAAPDVLAKATQFLGNISRG